MKFRITFAIIIALVMGLAALALFVPENPLIIIGFAVVLVAITIVLGSILRGDVGVHTATINEAAKDVAEGKPPMGSGGGTSNLDGLDGEFAEIMENIGQISAELGRYKEAEKETQAQITELTQDIENINAGLAKIIAGDLRGGSFGHRRAHTQGLDALIRHLLAVQADIDAITDSIKSGNFAVRSITQIHEKYGGEWKKITSNLEDASAAVLSVLSDAGGTLARLAKGHLDAKMTSTVIGGGSEYAKLRSNLNNATTALAKNVNDIHSGLTSLQGRGYPSGEFPQDFAKIKDAIVNLGNRMDETKSVIAPKLTSLRGKDAAASPSDIREKRAAAANRMSGAYKPKYTPKSIIGQDFLRNDFGKY